MDEHREARRELDEIQREDAEQAREQERIEWATHDGLSWAEFVTTETVAWSR